MNHLVLPRSGREARSSQITEPTGRPHILQYWPLALGVWFLVSAMGLWLVTARADRLQRQAEDSVLRRAEAAAEAIEQNLAHMLQGVGSLHDLAQTRQGRLDAGDQGGAQAIEAHLADIARHGRFGVLQVDIVGQDGWLAWSSKPGWQPAYLWDPDHLQDHRDGGHGLLVNEPLPDHSSGQRGVEFTRRIQDLSGAVSGMAVVSIDPAALSRGLTRLQPGEDSTAIVLRRDGVILARSRPEEDGLQPALPAADPLTAALPASISGQLRVPQDQGGRDPTLVGYRVVSETPLAVAVTVRAAQELGWAAFLRHAFQATIVSISLLALAIMALALLWLERRRTQSDLDLARREREAALEGLAHTQRMEALGRLAGGVAHDFNNVLQAVLGGAKLIARRPEDAAAVRRFASMISEAADRGASVTRRLLAFARRGELRAEIVDVVALLAGVREVLAHTLGAEIQVRLEADGLLPPVLADRGQLETVLVNLAVNGRDAMASRGGGTLTLSADPEEIPVGKEHAANLKPGRYLRLSVRDTGAGMDPATLARAAEPFFTTKPKSKGTGLGLAMAKGFAEQSGGAFRIESALGRGTIVTLWLPRAVSGAKPAVPKETEAAPPADTALPATGGIRVLLVDDEALVRTTLAENLATHGWIISEAESGAAALAWLDGGEAFDLLVTDLAMPGMDGLAVIREARRRRPGMPALLVTGHAGDAQVGLLAAAAAGGPFALLRKPVAADELRSRAEVLLQSGQVSAPVEDEQEPTLMTA
ncbi:response regulator [Roseicella aerolata]|uniref:histidine kinase n=1 Tax=Roseicella aerolata TaxID=2883479 RepID=A0A9X1IGJ4_9PROT|nr:response regulator [Roseicella aerolata]MCB4823293.1 response regulator [Roseicella aerolata]